GKLVIQSSRAALDEAAAQVALQAAFGCEQHVVGAAECLELEPGLQSIAHRIVGGVYTPSEEVGDCRMLCDSLRRSLNVEFRLGADVRGFEMSGRRIAALRTTGEQVSGDLYVLATGAQSGAVGRLAGVRIAVQPVRGYSITARVRGGNRAPVRSITDSDRKTVYAPLGDTLRVAGFAEIGGTASAGTRADSLVRDLDALFPGVCELEDVNPWSGLRPLTPTGLPLIGPTRVENLYLNVGQGALGFTLAAGSARLLSDLIAGRATAIPREPYAPQPMTEIALR
ncbi:MAG TPA: FAD-dependent oxidoreductase, partial [Acetobacteraceae bacterium]|nr:FAD-dependent oxidoreductase [Acetobacteraceae bacterium]